MKESLPLSDVTVIDLTIARAGPTAVRQLADWGANVVRVESPEGGFEAGGRSSPDYLNLHRNKRSLVIDLKHPEGRATLHRMVESADVLVDYPRLYFRVRSRWALRSTWRSGSDCPGVGGHDERNRASRPGTG